MPARQSFVIEMVDQREDLGNAIALNSSMVNGARLIGPAIAGMVVAAVGEGYCFLADGVSYIAVIVLAADDAIAAGEARKAARKVSGRNSGMAGDMWWSRRRFARSC